jgi:hypothetical protein
LQPLDANLRSDSALAEEANKKQQASETMIEQCLLEGVVAQNRESVVRVLLLLLLFLLLLLLLLLLLPQPPSPLPAVVAKQERRRQGDLYFTGEGRSRRGSASLRRADAAQVCSNVGFVAVDGVFECSVATAARHIVSERW